MRGRVSGTGSAVPDRVLTNLDLEKMVDTTDEWIVSRTGIKERRIASADEYTSTFATRAALQALEMSGVTPDELDMIIVATVTPDFQFPSTACILQNNIKAHNATAFDISAACSGFIYALSTVDKFIKAGTVKKALVIGAEVLSRIVDWTDRNSCLLFGDGAGAVVVEAVPGDHGIQDSVLRSDGSYWDLLYLPSPGSRNPVTQKALDDRLVYIRMQGNEVFKLAVRAMEEVALKLLASGGYSKDDIDLFIPHQANKRIIDSIGKRLGVPEDKIFVNIDHYGNTSAASIPIALDEANRSGRIKPGDLVLFDSFGGGLTWGAMTVIW